MGLVGGVQPAPPPTLAMQQWVQAAQQHMGEGAHVVQQLGAVLPPVFAGVFWGEEMFCVYNDACIMCVNDVYMVPCRCENVDVLLY